MIKRFLAAIMIALPVMAFAQVKFGTINPQPIIEAMPEMKEAQDALMAASNKFQEEYKLIEADITKKVTEYQQLPEDTPKVMRERRQKDLQELSQRAEEFRLTAERDLQRQQEQLFAPIQQKVNDAVTAVGKEGGYTFIFESTVPIFVGAEVVDVTDLVKAKLGIK